MIKKLQLGDYEAQLFVSKADPPIYHGVITKRGDSEIVSWCQCKSQKQCKRNAAAALRTVVGTKNSKAKGKTA